jgi:transposase
VLAEIVHHFPWLRRVFADVGYAGNKLADALRRISKWTIGIIKRSDKAKGFEVLPRRWVVERTRLAQPKSAPRQGLRADHRIRRSLAIPRLNPDDNSPDRKGLKIRRIISNQALINKAKNENRNGIVMCNCKTEATGLVNDARSLQALQTG